MAGPSAHGGGEWGAAGVEEKDLELGGQSQRDEGEPEGRRRQVGGGEPRCPGQGSGSERNQRMLPAAAPVRHRPRPRRPPTGGPASARLQPLAGPGRKGWLVLQRDVPQPSAARGCDAFRAPGRPGIPRMRSQTSRRSRSGRPGRPWC